MLQPAPASGDDEGNRTMSAVSAALRREYTLLSSADRESMRRPGELGSLESSGAPGGGSIVASAEAAMGAAEDEDSGRLTVGRDRYRGTIPLDARSGVWNLSVVAGHAGGRALHATGGLQANADQRVGEAGIRFEVGVFPSLQW